MYCGGDTAGYSCDCVCIGGAVAGGGVAAEATAELVLGVVSCFLFLVPFLRLERVGSLHSMVACRDLGPWCAQGPCCLHKSVILACRLASAIAFFCAGVRGLGCGVGWVGPVMARMELV